MYYNTKQYFCASKNKKIFGCKVNLSHFYLFTGLVMDAEEINACLELLKLNLTLKVMIIPKGTMKVKSHYESDELL